MAAAEAAPSRMATDYEQRMEIVSDHAVTLSTSSRPNNEHARVEPEDSIKHVAPAKRAGAGGPRKDLKNLLPQVITTEMRFILCKSC